MQWSIKYMIKYMIKYIRTAAEEKVSEHVSRPVVMWCKPIDGAGIGAGKQHEEREPV